MDPEQFNQSLSQLNRDKEQSQIDAVDDDPNMSDELNNSLQNKLMQTMAAGVKKMVKNETEKFQAADEIDTLNPMIQAQAGQVKPPQDKNYCQLCFREFGFLSRKSHCSMCSRTCCNQCSAESDQSEKQRTCDFCRIKIENSQIDRFYQLSKVWRQAEMDQVKQQISWYVEKTKAVREKVEGEREATAYLKSQAEEEFNKIEKDSNDLIEQRKYIDASRKRLERSIKDEQAAKIKVMQRLEEMKNRKRELAAKLDELQTKLDQKQKQKDEYGKQLAALDE